MTNPASPARSIDDIGLLRVRDPSCTGRLRSLARVALASEGARVLLGLGVGVGVGGLLAGTCLDCAALIDIVGFPGDMWMKGLKAVVLFLVPCSVAKSSADLRRLGGGAQALGGITIAYYLSTTFLSVIIGIIAVSTIVMPFTDRIEHELEHLDEIGGATAAAPPHQVHEQLLDAIGNLVPGNLVADAASLNLLPLISASVIAGLCLPADGVVLRGVDEVLEALSGLVRLLIRLTPVGVLSLVAHNLAKHWERLALVRPARAERALCWPRARSLPTRRGHPSHLAAGRAVHRRVRRCASRRSRPAPARRPPRPLRAARAAQPVPLPRQRRARHAGGAGQLELRGVAARDAALRHRGERRRSARRQLRVLARLDDQHGR